MNKNYYYIYYLIDPRNSQPFYVGKGRHVPRRTARWRNHITEAKQWNNNTGNYQKLSLITEILNTGQEPDCIIVGKYEDEITAFEVERITISKLGRLIDNTGILTNLTKGGEGISSVVEYKEEERERRRQKMIGKNNPMYGKHHTIASKQKMSQTTRQRLQNGDIIPKKHTQEHKQRLSEEGRLGKQTAKKVCQLCPDTKNIITIFASTRQAGKSLNIKCWRNISAVCNKYPNRKVGGYFWKWN